MSLRQLATELGTLLSWQQTVDSCWETFVSSLPTDMREEARQLPITLRLTQKLLPWSRIFHQEVTLALPFSFAEATLTATEDQIRRAVMAHMLGIIAAFGADRIDDGQLVATPEVDAVLSRIRDARDAALQSFGVSIDSPRYSYAAADVATSHANLVEKEFLATHYAADFFTYERLAKAKQFLAFPATMCFARAAGIGDENQEQLAAMCLAMAMGLQLRDDATDWEDDHLEGRSWVVRLLHCAEGTRDVDTAPQPLSARVAAESVLLGLLSRAAWHFEDAAHLATSLRAHRIAAWSTRQAQLTRTLLDQERKEPGHTVRWEIARKAARG